MRKRSGKGPQIPPLANRPIVIDTAVREEIPYEDLGRVLDILDEICVCMMRVYDKHAGLQSILEGYDYDDIKGNRVRKEGKMERISTMRGTLTESEKGSSTEKLLRSEIAKISNELALLMSDKHMREYIEITRDNPEHVESLTLGISRIRDRVFIPQGLGVAD